MTCKWNTPFDLPNGSQLKNRVAKAAMEEKMADVSKYNQPSRSLVNLYQKWGEGGAGLILSGHIMISPHAMAAPGDVLLAKDAPALDETVWREWIDKTQANGAQFWLQINHPGRQIPKGSGLPTYGPSAIPMKMGSVSSMFATPIAMAEEQIQDVISRFAWTAQKTEQLGAAGVEIHAAHGYLISQFLSPLSNKRTDRWGGSLENRSRLLFDVVDAVKKAVSPRFGVGIKINSADFQRGGFDEKDLWWVVEKLNGKSLDLVELSGGSYESPAMSGSAHTQSSSTIQREAYFLKAAQQIQDVAKMPVMVTGGISTLPTLESVINSSDNFIAGVGSAMGLVPDLPNCWMKGQDPAPSVANSWILRGRMNAIAKIVAVQYNINAHGGQNSVWEKVWPLYAMVVSFISESSQMSAYKKWLPSVSL